MTKIFLKIMCLSLFCNIQTVLAKDKTVITVNQIVSHIALDAAYQGLIKGLEDRGITQNANIILGNAQGNLANSVQISRQQASFMPDFTVAISSLSAQTALKAKSEKTILAFLAVTDPEAVGLAGREDVIGVSDNPPVEELIEKTLLIFPNTKNIGVIYNSGEINSTKVVTKLENILKAKSINLKKATIANSNETKNAFNKLASSVELIYIPQDNTVVSALDSLTGAAKARKIPIIANDPTLVANGVLLALGYNYRASGVQLAGMIADLIEGKKLNANIQRPFVSEFKINKESVNQMNITIPENIASEITR